MTKDGLSAWLLHPDGQASLVELCGLWRETLVRASCLLDPPPWQEGVAPWELAGKVRGSWGDDLKRGASPLALAGQPCPWWPPCALDVFFRPQGKLTGGLEIPKPYVIRVDYEPEAGMVRIVLALFGLAGDYATAAAASLAAALRHNLRWAQGRAPGCELADMEIVAAPAPDPGDGAHKACLRFLAPLNQRSGRECLLSPQSMLTGLANRVSGLARWHGLELVEDFKELKRLIQSLQGEFEQAERHHWFRQSQRQDGRNIPMEGFLGDLWLRGDLLALTPLLALGERCHAGGRAALGMGQYRLEWQR